MFLEGGVVIVLEIRRGMLILNGMNGSHVGLCGPGVVVPSQNSVVVPVHSVMAAIVCRGIAFTMVICPLVLRLLLVLLLLLQTRMVVVIGGGTPNLLVHTTTPPIFPV